MLFTITVPDAAVPRIEAAYRARMPNGATATRAEVAQVVRQDLYDVLRSVVHGYEDDQAANARRVDPTDPLVTAPAQS